MDTLFKKIVVPLDGSTNTETVIPLAQAFAQDANTEIVLLYVADEVGRSELDFATTPALVGAVSPELERELLHNVEDLQDQKLADARLRAEGYLQRLMATWFKRGTHVTSEVCFGSASDVILEFVEARWADLILMSMHGWTPNNRKGIADVTDQVIRLSKVPVLSVRQPYVISR